MVGRHGHPQIGDRRHIRRLKIQLNVVLLVQLHIAGQNQALPPETRSLIQPDLHPNGSAPQPRRCAIAHQDQSVAVPPLQPQVGKEDRHLIRHALHPRGTRRQLVQRLAAPVEDEVRALQRRRLAEVDVLALQRPLQLLQAAQRLQRLAHLYAQVLIQLQRPAHLQRVLLQLNQPHQLAFARLAQRVVILLHALRQVEVNRGGVQHAPHPPKELRRRLRPVQQRIRRVLQLQHHALGKDHRIAVDLCFQPALGKDQHELAHCPVQLRVTRRQPVGRVRNPPRAAHQFRVRRHGQARRNELRIGLKLHARRRPPDAAHHNALRPFRRRHLQRHPQAAHALRPHLRIEGVRHAIALLPRVAVQHHMNLRLGHTRQLVPSIPRGNAARPFHIHNRPQRRHPARPVHGDVQVLGRLMQ